MNALRLELKLSEGAHKQLLEYLDNTPAWDDAKTGKLVKSIREFSDVAKVHYGSITHTERMLKEIRHHIHKCTL
jgi:hypothetical protein